MCRPRPYIILIFLKWYFCYCVFLGKERENHELIIWGAGHQSLFVAVFSGNLLTPPIVHILFLWRMHHSMFFFLKNDVG